MSKKNKKATKFGFKPFSMQQKRVLNWWRTGTPTSHLDMIIADGAIRSGKTIAMICSFLQWSQEMHKGQTFIMAGKSIGSLKRNVVNPMLQILTSWGWGYYFNRSENYIQIGDNTYYLFGANKENSQDTLQGLTAAGALADEAALFPQSFIDQMIGRCSVEHSKIFMNCNPGSPYHYLKTDFIDCKKEKKVLHLHFTMDDNLSLAESTKARYKRMFKGVFYQRYILGLWVLAEGLIYSMFSEQKNVVPTTPRKYKQLYVSCDYGTQNPMAFGLWGLSTEDGTWYKVKEYHHDARKKQLQKTDQEYLEDLKAFVGNLTKRIVVDPSASSFIILLKKNGFMVRKAKNDVLEGIRNMATALGEGRIKYNDCCKETLREMTTYVWDEKAMLRGEDKPVKQNDHQLDADRYFVNTVLYNNQAISFE